MHFPVTRRTERAEELHVQEAFPLPSAGVVDFGRLPFADETGRVRCQELAP
jgi:hypothetical protein